MRKILYLLIIPVFLFSEQYDYSLLDYNSTSPTYQLDVWNPEYSGFITLHYFSTQG